MRGVGEGMETVAGESPSAGQLAENLSDPADADVAYRILWNVRARSCQISGPPVRKVRGSSAAAA
jgi:hypothetical protein